MTLAPHSRLGQYEILAPLGAGGMGEVYRAADHASAAKWPSRRCRKSSQAIRSGSLASSVKRGCSPR